MRHKPLFHAYVVEVAAIAVWGFVDLKNALRLAVGLPGAGKIGGVGCARQTEQGEEHPSGIAHHRLIDPAGAGRCSRGGLPAHTSEAEGSCRAYAPASRPRSPTRRQ